MARPTAAPAIAHTRRLLADPDSARWSDDQIQVALDQVAETVTQLDLTVVPARTASGVDERTWQADAGWWEAPDFQDSHSWATLTPDSSDDDAGRWTFPAEPSGVVAITGVWHDPAAAAADLLDETATAIELGGPLSYKIDDATIDRSSQVAALRSAAARLRGQARSARNAQAGLPLAVSGTIVRDDVAVWW